MIAAAHAWWPVLWHWPRFLDPLSWWWNSTRGYAFTSSGLQLSIPAGLIVYLRRHNCHAPWCLRLGRHPSNDGQHHFCRRHHPDLPNRRLSLQELHDRHHQGAP